MTREEITRLKAEYPRGTRIRMLYMADPHAVQPGSLGTVQYIDNIGDIQMQWDDGRTLAICPEVDRFEKVVQP